MNSCMVNRVRVYNPCVLWSRREAQLRLWSAMWYKQSCARPILNRIVMCESRDLYQLGWCTPHGSSQSLACTSYPHWLLFPPLLPSRPTMSFKPQHCVTHDIKTTFFFPRGFCTSTHHGSRKLCKTIVTHNVTHNITRSLL